MIAKSAVLLEKEGFIIRVTDENDKRVKLIYLTDKGKALQPELKQIGQRVNSSLLKDLTKEDASTVIENMRKIAFNASEL